jgi:sialate O-acetylesterase
VLKNRPSTPSERKLMKSRHILAVFALAGALLTNDAVAQRPRAPQQAGPPPFVSTLFADNMVLERNRPDAIWGWSDPGDQIKVEIAGKTATAVAGADRRWQTKIDPPAVGGPYTMTITGQHQAATIKNVAVGDVWLCSGQSNMQFGLRQAKTGTEDAAKADLPNIRFFTVAQRSPYHPIDNVSGSWNVVTPDTAGRVAAVAFYFARKVQQETHIPVGLIISAVGGVPAETFMSIDAVKQIRDFDPLVTEYNRIVAENKGPEYGNFVQHWYDDYDIGMKEHWAAPDYDDSSWKTVTIPGGFAELGVPDTPALVYFRKTFDVSEADATPPPAPAAAPGGPGGARGPRGPGGFPGFGRDSVQLGIIEKMDTVYINGQEIGGSAWVENPRRYGIRPGMLHPGKNVITIRVLKSIPKGGFESKPEDLKMTIGDKTIPLAGEWKAKLAVDGRPPQPMPLRYQNWPQMPGVLYTGMLQPIAPYSLAGAIWYQGEENSPRGYQYRRVLSAMIADWRKTFQEPDMPFIVVQLPAFMQHSDTPTDDDWSDLRESQLVVSQTVPNTCLAVTIDTGDPNNIHPTDKEPAGDRIARCALKLANGDKKVVAEGPTVDKVERRKGEIRIKFSHADGGLVAKGDKLPEFAIAGDDQQFHWASARIEGDTIIVSSPDVANPKEVRYAWQSYPNATLFNGAGLPASPFRTDHWKVETESARPY